MFGEAGCLHDLQAIVGRDWYSAAESWLHGGRSHMLGIYPGKEELCFIELERKGVEWQAVRMSAETLPPVLAGDGLPETADEKSGLAARWAEGVSMGLAREGWESMPLALCLPDGLGFSCLTALPPGLENEELREAAHWELEAKLLEEEPGLTLAEMYWDFAPLDGAEQNYLLTAVKQSLAEAVRAVFEAQGLELSYLTLPMPPLQGIRIEGDSLWLGGVQVKVAPLAQSLPLSGLRPAFYAAASAVRLGGQKWPGALGEQAFETWNYKGLALSWLACISCVLLCVLAFDVGNLYEAKENRDAAVQELIGLDEARRQMELLESVRRQVENKEAQLAELSSHSFPWYSLLVHFGSITVQGVWIDGLKLEGEDSLKLSGQAVNYEALAEFMRAFEQDTFFFPEGPVLETSEVQENGHNVSFKLHLKL